MSVTFNRAQLIKVTTQALAAHEKAAGQRAKQVEEFKRKHAKNATVPTQTKARLLRDALTKAIKSPASPVRLDDLRSVIGSSDLRDLFYREPDDYSIKRELEGVPTGLMSPAEVVESRALLKVLNAADGDTVSVNELKLLGLKNLGPVFTAAAKAT